MHLQFFFIPTADLGASLALCRDGFGFTEAWREGDETVALDVPRSDVQLMLDAHDADAPAGPIYLVEDLRAWHATKPEALGVIEQPAEIPGGYQAVYADPGGALIYVMDQSTDA